MDDAGSVEILRRNFKNMGYARLAITYPESDLPRRNKRFAPSVYMPTDNRFGSTYQALSSCIAAEPITVPKPRSRVYSIELGGSIGRNHCVWRGSPWDDRPDAKQVRGGLKRASVSPNERQIRSRIG